MKNIFKFICCGNVDDGKSTLIGRLLLDTGNVKKDQLEDALKASRRNGSDHIELSMLLDGLLAEREQQITIDVAHRYFDYQNIRFHILDCPGHSQYTKNMATAAACADSAIVVIDATKGIREQTKRHLQICSLFQLKNICICLTKCDLLSKSEAIRDLTDSINTLLKTESFSYTIIPVSAVTGYNIDKVLSVLIDFAKQSAIHFKENNKTIFHIQAAKLYQGERYYYGKNITSYEIKSSKMKLIAYPSQKTVTISKQTASLPIGCIQLNENIDLSAGDCLANTPIITANIISHKTIWFEEPTHQLLLKHGTRIVQVKHLTDSMIELDNVLFFNNIEDIKENGFGILIDAETKRTIGCCVFTGNKEINIHQKTGKIYYLRAKHISNKEALIETIKNQFTLPPVILEWDTIYPLLDNDISKAAQKLIKIAELMITQGHHVVILDTINNLPVHEYPLIQHINVSDNSFL